MAALCGVADAKLTELKTGDDIWARATGDEFDFAIVSFYKPSDPASVQIHKLIEGAQFVFEKNVDERKFSARRLGWFQVDIEFDPDLSMLAPGEFG